MAEKKKRVLIVDDSTFSAEEIRRIVEETGIAEVVGHAKDGLEGIKMYKELLPDVVFLDIMMPKMDGIQTLRSIKAINKNAKVVMISSVGGSAQKSEEALRYGAVAILSKPFEPEKIQKILKEI